MKIVEDMFTVVTMPTLNGCVLVHKETGIAYLAVNNVGLTVMLDTKGKPLVVNP